MWCPKCKKNVEVRFDWKVQKEGLIEHFCVCKECNNIIPDSFYFKPPKTDKQTLV